jgi:hypothetical protein
MDKLSALDTDPGGEPDVNVDTGSFAALATEVAELRGQVEWLTDQVQWNRRAMFTTDTHFAVLLAEMQTHGIRLIPADRTAGSRPTAEVWQIRSVDGGS